MNKMALQATLHCLFGCTIGEVIGMMIGSYFGLHGFIVIVISITLAFISGYSLSLLPVVRSGIRLGDAMKLVLAADTLSITTMEIVDNLIIVAIPGALGAPLTSWHFWLSMLAALLIAFLAAYPVNAYLLSRNKGHAITHRHMHHH